MTLLRPEWLLLLPLIAAWFWHGRVQPAGGGVWQRYFDQSLLEPLLRDGAPARLWAERMRWLSLFLLPVALAGPAITDDAQPGQRLSPVIIVLSQSPTMRHNDLAPSRYQRASRAAERWLAANPGRPVSLIAYSGSAHLIAPPTEDHNTLRLMLSQLSPDIMPVKGRASGPALRMAIERARVTSADILWLTDHVGDADTATLPDVPGDARLQVLVAADENARGPVRGPDGNTVRNATGQAMLTDPDIDRLRALVQTLSGNWQWLTDENTVADQFLAPRRQAGPSESVSGWRDLGPLLFLALLPGLLLQLPLAGSAAGVLLLLTLATLPTADAAGGWWQNRDQQALDRLSEAPAEAADLFTNPQWQAYASLLADRPQQALERISDDRSAWGAYHRGIALTRLGRYEQALSAFNSAVDERPDWPEALANRDLLREWLNNRTQNPAESGRRSGGDPDDQRRQSGEPTAPEPGPGTPSPGADSADRDRNQRAGQRLPPPDRSFLERKLRYQWEQQREQ